MTPVYFDEMMQGFGCHTMGRTAFGVAGQLPYSLELEGQGSEKQAYVLRCVLDGSAHPLAARLNAQKVENLRWSAEGDAVKGNGVLVGVYRPPSDFYVKAGVRGMLDSLQDAAVLGGRRAPEACPLCGLPRCDRYACLDDGYRATHAACLQSRLNLPERDVTPPKKVKGNVATGILGALLGALIAALPNWAIALSQGKIHFVLYAFIPLLSALVYRLCRGKASPLLVGLSVLLSSLLAAFALEQVWYWLVLSSYRGYTVSFATSIADYFVTHNITVSVREMLPSLIALLVGYFASMVFLRRYTTSRTEHGKIIRGSAYVRESARPIHEPPADDTAEPAPAVAPPEQLEGG